MDKIYDVAIIGAGVVGCAIARRFTLEGAKVVVLEKANDLLEGASKGNSGVLHTGFDAPSGTLEWACMRAGHAEYMSIKDRFGLPTLDEGAVVVAFNDSEAAELEPLREKAERNQVAGVERMDRKELLAREPHLSPAVVAGLFVPGECVIDPWSAPLAYLRQALENGADVRFGEEVQGGKWEGRLWRLRVNSGEVLAEAVINCAGNFGDIVDQRVLGEASFTIRPRKGQFVVFDKPAAMLVNSMILPIPGEQTKGVLVTRTIFGNVLVGPTAEEQEDRERALADEETTRELIAKAISIVPALANVDPIAAYAGLRPATDEPGYRIEARPDRHWITVGGIRSTGLTAALGLAQHVFGLYASGWPQEHAPLLNPAWPCAPQLAEFQERDWQRPGSGEIVCECEKVTAREIESALSGSLPARDLGGLKRRTRVMMGRCQGERCFARVAELAGGRLANLSESLRAGMLRVNHR